MNTALIPANMKSPYGNWTELPFSKEMTQAALSCYDTRSRDSSLSDTFWSYTRTFFNTALIISELVTPTLVLAVVLNERIPGKELFRMAPISTISGLFSSTLGLHIFNDAFVRPLSRILAKENCNSDEQLISDLHASINQAKTEYQKYDRIMKAHEYTLIVGTFCDHYSDCGFSSKVYENNPLYQTYLRLKDKGKLDQITEYLSQKIQEAYFFDTPNALPETMIRYYSPTHQERLNNYHPAGSSCSKPALENLELLDPEVRPSKEWLERVKKWCNLIERVKIGYLQRH